MTLHPKEEDRIASDANEHEYHTKDPDCWCPVGWKERFAQGHFADKPHIHIPDTCCPCRGLDSHCCA